MKTSVVMTSADSLNNWLALVVFIGGPLALQVLELRNLRVQLTHFKQDRWITGALVLHLGTILFFLAMQVMLISSLSGYGPDHIWIGIILWGSLALVVLGLVNGPGRWKKVPKKRQQTD